MNNMCMGLSGTQSIYNLKLSTQRLIRKLGRSTPSLHERVKICRQTIMQFLKSAQVLIGLMAQETETDSI